MVKTATKTTARRGGRVSASKARQAAKEHLGGAQQTADSGAGAQQGAEGAAPNGSTNDVIEVGGIKIETMPIPGRGGRQQSAEKYPFSQLAPSKRLKNGAIEGPSFLIPDDDNPDNHIAAARKRHKNMSFTTRKMKDGGVRIWRNPA